MGLFGEKCGRCGRRTRHTYQGKPTCEPCETEIEARLRADQESARECPLDRVAMGKEVAYGIVLDRCPTCGGVWLDRDELDLIRRGVEARTAQQILRGMSYPA